jgi:UDP-2,3-diacylglucosamine pyrophosphatase LpxH
MSVSQVIVISDLHISAAELDDFDDELEGCFQDFLPAVAPPQDAVELVINGDFLDFVQAPPWEKPARQQPPLFAAADDGTPLSFTEAQSLAKFGSIVARHAPVFRALGDFLRRNAGNRLVILPGNHDPDFYWDAVQAAFRAALGGPDRVHFHLERSYQPTGCPGVWVEHGHQYDRCNAFFLPGGQECWSAAVPPVLPGKDGALRLVECVGTRLLVRFLNALDKDYHFVDNIKPFGRFLRIFGLSALMPGYAPIKAAVAVWRMFRFLAHTLGHTPADFLASQEATEQLAPLLQEWAEQLPPDDVHEFKNRLAGRGFPLERHLGMYLGDEDNAQKLAEFLSENLDLLDGLPQGLTEGEESFLSAGEEDGTLTLIKGFSADETKDLIDAARRLLKDGSAGAVVMGHTHQVVNRPGGIGYLNTGCWTRYYRFAEDESVRRWSLLRDPLYEFFPYQLNYARLLPGKHPSAELVTFRESPHAPAP